MLRLFAQKRTAARKAHTVAKIPTESQADYDSEILHLLGLFEHEAKAKFPG